MIAKLQMEHFFKFGELMKVTSHYYHANGIASESGKYATRYFARILEHLYSEDF